jgi:hypothetical protein
MNLNLDPDEYVERLHQNIKSAWNQGAEAERERIVKLVTVSQAINPDQKYFLLKAIKGEQK